MLNFVEIEKIYYANFGSVSSDTDIEANMTAAGAAVLKRSIEVLPKQLKELIINPFDQRGVILPEYEAMASLITSQDVSFPVRTVNDSMVVREFLRKDHKYTRIFKYQDVEYYIVSVQNSHYCIGAAAKSLLSLLQNTFDKADPSINQDCLYIFTSSYSTVLGFATPIAQQKAISCLKALTKRFKESATGMVLSYKEIPEKSLHCEIMEYHIQIKVEL